VARNVSPCCCTHPPTLPHRQWCQRSERPRSRRLGMAPRGGTYPVWVKVPEQREAEALDIAMTI